MEINAVDLFCGIGGLTYGVQSTGINVVAGIDNEESCRYAYEKNNGSKFILRDIKDLKDYEISSLYPKTTNIHILMGCAPCQPFSLYSHRYKNSNVHTQKLDLLDYFGRQVELLQPEIVSMENVPQLEKEPIFAKFIQLLEKNNYRVTWKIVYAPDYEVPQNRKRLLLLASKLGEIDFFATI